MRNIFLFILTLLVTSAGYNSKDNGAPKGQYFLGTTWAANLKGPYNDFFWLSCDSTFMSYDAEALRYYYGKFEIKSDTLIFKKQYEDDYHKYSNFPIKVRSLGVEKYLIVNDSTLLFISYDHVKAAPGLVYKLKQRFNCNSLDNH